MRALTSLILLCASAAFVPSSVRIREGVAARMGYVPDGMSPEEYRELRKKEQEGEKAKKYGAFGPQSFVSRSLQSFQTDMEKGKASHLMPVMFAKQLVKTGQLQPEQVPYMQRGGAWDNSDVPGAKKKEWNDKDKVYSPNEKPGWGSGIPTGGPSSASASPAAKTAPPKRFGLF